MNHATEKADRPGQPVPLAFFDLDGTLVLGQTQRMMVAFLRRRGLVGRRFLLGTLAWFAGYRLGLLRATDKARARGAVLFKGLAADEVDRLMAQFVDEVLAPRVFSPAVQALQEHAKRGERVVILSAAFAPLVAAFARLVGVDDFCATRLETEAGRYTGAVLGTPLYGPEKARVAGQRMLDEGVEPAVCSAYADHETDLALLKAVGTPVAVRPRPALLAHAQEHGWRVLG